MSQNSIPKTHETLTFFSNSINNSSIEDEIYYEYTFQLVTSIVLPMVLKSTIDLGILQVIHEHGPTNGLSPLEIVAKLEIKNADAPAMVDRMLRLLASYSVVRSTHATVEDGGVERRYCSSPVTKFLVPDDDGFSLGALLNLVVDKNFLESWSKLKDAVIEGGVPFNMAHGMSAFEYFHVNSSFNDDFNKAMRYTTTFVMEKILQKYKGFENIKQLVDVGGGVGHSLSIITSQYPSIKAINFDLPHVIQNALPCPGVEHVWGNMFESIPTAEVVLLKWIIHNWSDEYCHKLLKNCYKALPENGKIIVIEAIMPEEPETTISARALSQEDLHMMAQYHGGKERTMNEFQALAMAAGFANVKLVCCVYGYSVMEFYKK